MGYFVYLYRLSVMLPSGACEAVHIRGHRDASERVFTDIFSGKGIRSCNRLGNRTFGWENAKTDFQ